MAEEAVRNEVNSIKIVTFFAFLLAMSHTECSTDCGLTRAPPPEPEVPAWRSGTCWRRGPGKWGRGGQQNDASEDPGCV